MHNFTALAAWCLCALPVWAQTPPVPAGGLETPWDVRKIAADLQRDLEAVQPLLSQVNPQAWVDQKGAPSTYIVQLQAAQQQARDALVVTKNLASQTDSLSVGLDTYFRLEALETSERALSEGARQYDTRANADKLNVSIARNFDSRQRLRDYLRNLAVSTEQNFKIADGEAQRCRSSLSQQPATMHGAKKK